VGVLIHAGSVDWHQPFAEKMRRGLKTIGIDAGITASRSRESDVAILLGTTMWRAVEGTGTYLLVDRCSFGDTNHWVSLVWNGHGRRGNHKVPRELGNRWETIGVPVAEWRTGSKIVLCGQHQPYSPAYMDLREWYSAVPNATHFRPHPVSDNPTGLPSYRGWLDVGLVITLNSSVAIDSVLLGIPTVTMDGGAMAWDVTGHRPDEIITPDRTDWLRWLAWTQWHHDEINAGHPIKHLFEDVQCL